MTIITFELQYENIANNILSYINTQRTKNNLSLVTHNEVASTLFFQFMKDKYIEMEINNAKQTAEDKLIKLGL